MLRTRSKVFKDKKEINQAIRGMALNHDVLSKLAPSYVTSLLNITASMKIEDPKLWFSLVDYVAKSINLLELRDLSSTVHSLAKVSKLKPVILNFDDLYRQLEICFVKKFDKEMQQGFKADVGVDLMTTLTSYSRTQNGSV
jgi:hypothetical protein